MTHLKPFGVALLAFLPFLPVHLAVSLLLHRRHRGEREMDANAFVAITRLVILALGAVLLLW